VINNTLARRYAKALVQIGSEDGLIDRFRDELTAVDRVFTEQKKEIMKDLIAKVKCSELIGNFLLLLVDKNRVAFLDQIVHTYETLADEQSGIIRPLIKTAFALDAGQVSSIQSALEKKSGKKVIPQVTVDQSLLGGVVTQIGDTAFDSSVKTQLKRIQDILQKG
jgi:F-type H+-transporting ATPase subunit delta